MLALNRALDVGVNEQRVSFRVDVLSIEIQSV